MSDQRCRSHYRAVIDLQPDLPGPVRSTGQPERYDVCSPSKRHAGTYRLQEACWTLSALRGMLDPIGFKRHAGPYRLQMQKEAVDGP